MATAEKYHCFVCRCFSTIWSLIAVSCHHVHQGLSVNTSWKGFSWLPNPGTARLKAKAEQRLLLSVTQLYAPFETKTKLWGRANIDSGTAAASASDRLAVNLGAEPWRLRAQTAWIDNSFADRNRSRQALRLIIPPLWKAASLRQTVGTIPKNQNNGESSFLFYFHRLLA